MKLELHYRKIIMLLLCSCYRWSQRASLSAKPIQMAGGYIPNNRETADYR